MKRRTFMKTCAAGALTLAGGRLLPAQAPSAAALACGRDARGPRQAGRARTPALHS